MKVLITGASGFIGQALIRDLSGAAGIELFALSRHFLDIPGITYLSGDILDATCLDKIFSTYRFDVVFHLAAITAHSEIVDNRLKTFDTNLCGTTNLLNSFNAYCTGAQFIYASTGKVYGKTNEMPITENAQTRPQNILGKTKYMTEQVIDFYAVPENRYLICRIFNIYGEYQKRNFVVPTIIDQLGDSKITLGNLKDLRDYLYVDDLTSALQACMRNSSKFKNVDYVNIGSGEPTCVVDILREIECLIGRTLTILINQEKYRKDETPVEFCSNEKLSLLTGWSPQYSLTSGLKKTLISEGIIKPCRL